MAKSWANGKITVFGYSFTVDVATLEDITGLKNVGEKVCWPKHPLATELEQFFGDREEPKWDNKSPRRNSLSPPWAEVAAVVMDYLMMDAQYTWVRGYHLALLNNIRWGKQVNYPHSLYSEMDQAAELRQRGGMKYVLHLGLFNLVFKHMMVKEGWFGKMIVWKRPWPGWRRSRLI